MERKQNGTLKHIIMVCLVLLAASLCIASEKRLPKLGDIPERPSLPPQKVAAGDQAKPVRKHKMNLQAAKSELEALLQQQVKQLQVPGMAAGLVHDGHLVWWRGVGVQDLSSKAPVTADTIFRIGSITKIFTGLAILALRDAGKLHLDIPVARFVPEVSQVVYPTIDSPRITIRHLVTHTSGLPRMGKLDYTPADARITEKSLLAGLCGLKLEAAPGTRTKYSNLAMGLAGILVHRASGQTLRRYVATQILGPLGMKATVWDQSAVPAGRLATGYHRREGKAVTKHHWRMGASEGLGGLYSSLNDMARFMAFQLDAWPPHSAPDKGPVRRSSLRESHLVAGFALPGIQAFGVNWASIHHPKLGFSVAHAGGTYQYAAAVWMLPQRRLGMILLSNSGGDAGEVASKLPALAVALLDIVLKHNPDPGAKLSKPQAAALQQVLKLLENPDTDAVKQLFAPSFLKAFPLERVVDLLRKSGSALGSCTGHRVLQRIGEKGAVVQLTCEKGSAEVTIYLASPTDVSIAGFGISKVNVR
jgi:CubicO group peptidase (beta-lactamase class C family)